MKALVIYDSLYKNTETIAKAIGKSITDDVHILHVKEVDPLELPQDLKLLIIGSPVHVFHDSLSLSDLSSRS
jgi:flavodoxin